MIIVAPKFKLPYSDMQGWECLEDPDRKVAAFADEEKVVVITTNGSREQHSFYLPDTAERVFWALGRALGLIQGMNGILEWTDGEVRSAITKDFPE